MNILITGGAGFIGTNFVHQMIDKEYEIAVLDKLTYAGRKENLKDLKLRFIKGDMSDKRTAEKAVKGSDIVINFAAESHVDRAIKDPTNFLSTNIFGVFNLLEAARKYDVEKFIQISTDEVYGPIMKGSFEETDSLAPTNPYSASKASAEHVCNAYFRTYGLPLCITRSSNNFGPYQNPEKFIAMIIVNSLLGKAVTLYGDGRQVRDWIYVADNCSAILAVMEKGREGEIYNIGANNERTNLEVARTVLGILRKPLKLIKFVEDRKGHDFRYSMNCTKIKKLGWKPKHKFESALKTTADWYINNNKWWSKQGSILKPVQ